MLARCTTCKSRLHKVSKTYQGMDMTFQTNPVKYLCPKCADYYSYEPETGYRRLMED